MAGSRRSLPSIVQRRDLGERKIFGKAFSGEILGCTTQDGEKRATCRIGTTGATIEVRGDPGTGERMLQQPDIVLRRADDDRHFVETDAAIGFFQDPAGDLDAFAAFARRRKPHQFTRARSLRRRLFGKQITRKLGQIILLGFVYNIGVARRASRACSRQKYRLPAP